jgi:hypothetical protein
LKKRFADRTRGSRRIVRVIVAVVTFAFLAVSEFGGPAWAASLYWDTDGSTGGNNASTGANLGDSGIWSTADANWWNSVLGTLQAWTDGSDAVFWGTAGAVTASDVSANSLTFKTTGYSIDSGPLTLARMFHNGLEYRTPRAWNSENGGSLAVF